MVLTTSLLDFTYAFALKDGIYDLPPADLCTRIHHQLQKLSAFTKDSNRSPSLITEGSTTATFFSNLRRRGPHGRKSVEDGGDGGEEGWETDVKTRERRGYLGKSFDPNFKHVRTKEPRSRAKVLSAIESGCGPFPSDTSDSRSPIFMRLLLQPDAPRSDPPPQS